MKTDEFVIRKKDVMQVFHCSDRTAMNKINEVRTSLGKPTNIAGQKGAPPITMRQLKEHFGLYPKSNDTRGTE